ncbi:MAG TPA: LLM class flavin-dependent oxidoreductase [Acidimicrobiales bacterium]|nr:LLM class flavin-dependent oxidoreductase [Acidimicrobiales bacterium]HMS88824.1 LLM class flavin-dependent oxidoreductase [Acidimicrobiales bacterium]HRA33475.1 LLM class flavin-dependent oxidoreductase [Acidimicrobiales bacterium]
MEIGLALPQMTAGLDRDRIRAWCRAIDDGPFSSVSAGERITFDNLDGRTLLAAAAALTDRVRIFFNLVVAPWHPPALLAKELASLDVLSQGRVDVALGVGGRQQDYDALGAPFTGRFGRLDRTAAELRRLWAGGLIDDTGGGGDGADGGHPVGPTPVQPGGPRLLCSGTGPQSLARAARWADGLSSFALEAAPAEVTSVYGLADAAWADAGRAERPRRVTGTFAALGPGAEATLHAYARRYLDVFGTDLAAVLAAAMPVHTDEALHTFLTGLAAAGCDEVILVAADNDPDQVRRFAAAVEAFRAEPATAAITGPTA